jgi:hypothetical protein
MMSITKEEQFADLIQKHVMSSNMDVEGKLVILNRERDHYMEKRKYILLDLKEFTMDTKKITDCMNALISIEHIQSAILQCIDTIKNTFG